MSDIDRVKKAEYQKRWYEKNRTRHMANVRETKEQQRLWLRQQKIGKCCKYCTEDDPRCLDYHHRDRSTKLADVSNMWHQYGKPRILEEIAKCDLVCANCHRKIDAQYGPVS